MRTARRASLVTIALLVCSLVFSTEVAAPSQLELPVDGGTAGESGVGTGIALDHEEAVAPVLAAALPDPESFTVETPDLEVALISSGVDTTVLPESLPERVTELGNTSDPVGYGTYVASVVLQMAPAAHITSIGVYPNGAFRADWQQGALDWIRQNTDDLDVVLYAVPPSDFVDPISAVQAAGWWDYVASALSEAPIEASSGPVYGAQLANHLRAAQTADRPGVERWALDAFADLVTKWATARWTIQQITEAGVAVVSSAGDLGPGPQTVLGLANLPEVITVGGSDSGTISARTSSGPSIEGRVKPDLLAPTGVVGLLPETSPLASYLDANELIDSTLEPIWSAGDPDTWARARVDSTMTAAAVVAVAMAGMRADGIADVDTQRGALTAAAVPVDGEPVWRQGAGVLRRSPDGAFAASTWLATAHGDLGTEPASGTWSATIPIENGAAAAAAVSDDDFMGVGPDASPTFADLAAGGGESPVSATVTPEGVDLLAPIGDQVREAGLYCGYTEVTLPGSGAGADPPLSAHGIPEGVEQVPTCRVEGTRVEGFNHYIHMLPAEDLTMALLPSIPAGRSILDQPLHLLPVSPLDAVLFFGVSDRDGVVRFDNVPPGYYRVRQWSDYGTPVVQTVTASASGDPVEIAGDLGKNPGYRDFDTLLLSAVCADTFDPAAQAAGDPCSEDFLETVFGTGNVQRDKPTATFMVDVADQDLRVSFGYFKQMPGPSVTSRQIDLVAQDDFENLSASLAGALDAAWLDETTGLPVPVWEFAPGGDDPERLDATFNPAAAPLEGDVTLGVASYPFNIPTPNYTMHMSLDFSYELTNAQLIPVVVVEGEVGWGIVDAVGTFQGPTLSPHAPIGVDDTELGGHGEGEANFDFHFKPQGATEGMLYLIFVPPVPTPLSRASVGDLSFEIDTWTSVPWPATAFPLPNPLIDTSVYPEGATPGSGHTFSFDARFPGAHTTRRQQQITGECRDVDNGAISAEVCEDWTVIVHSPKDHAATFDLVDEATGTSLLSSLRQAGAQLVDPERKTVDFFHGLAFAAGNAWDLDTFFAGQQPMKANGRFWEQLAVPFDVIRAFPGRVEVRIQDYLPGRDSPVLPHTTGPVPVAPYVPFAADAVFLKDLGG